MDLHTARLWLTPLSLKLVLRRLEHPGFDLPLGTAHGPPARVHFPPAWPGEALGLFGSFLEHGSAGLNVVLVRRKDLCAIGLMGMKGQPDARGDWEIGYGLNPEARSQGYASEALGALLPSLLARPGVRRVTAETAVTNPASARVLHRCGFVQVGTGHSEEDGALLRWATPG